MTYDFDCVIDRRDTDSVKWGFLEAWDKGAETLPLWVADMDFQAPPCVREALRRAVDHGIFGYSAPRRDYFEAVSGWFARRFGWEPEEDWLVTTPGVVFAIAVAIQALTEPGDGVLVQTPVYYPFYNMIEENGRRVVRSPLRLRDGRYEIDFADLEAKLSDSNTKMLLLCSPHNPIGRVWTREELRRVGELCRAHGVLVVSDEIHCDFAFPEHPHTMLLQACPEIADRAVLCTAPSKSFNLAGLQASNIFIPDPALRQRYQAVLSRNGYFSLNTLALTACAAAYRDGADWLDQCRAYLRGNLDRLREFLDRRLPTVRLIEPEGTYFAWLDCRALGLRGEALDRRMLDCGLWLDGGGMFGPEGEGFQRLVLACPRATLDQALERLATVDREE